MNFAWNLKHSSLLFHGLTNRCCFQDSSLPAAVFVWEVKNHSDAELDVSITFTFKNGQGVAADRDGGVWSEAFTQKQHRGPTKVSGVMIHQEFNEIPCTYAIAAKDKVGMMCIVLQNKHVMILFSPRSSQCYVSFFFTRRKLFTCLIASVSTRTGLAKRSGVICGTMEDSVAQVSCARRTVSPFWLVLAFGLKFSELLPINNCRSSKRRDHQRGRTGCGRLCSMYSEVWQDQHHGIQSDVGHASYSLWFQTNKVLQVTCQCGFWRNGWKAKVDTAV